MSADMIRAAEDCECRAARSFAPGCSAESIYPPLPADWRERLAALIATEGEQR